VCFSSTLEHCNRSMKPTAAVICHNLTHQRLET
jgi:hypothetical protein